MRLKKYVLAVLLTASVGFYLSDVATAAPTNITACATITASGSFKLANNISSVGFEGPAPDCLVIASGVTNVTIDLDGFTIDCVLDCSGFNSGIRVGNVIEGLTVRNGTIKGFATGLSLFGNTMLIERMQIIRNRDRGLVAVESVRVIDSIFAGNGVGADVGEGSVLIGNEFNFNTSDGLRAGQGSTIINNSARRNGGIGLSVTCPSTVVGNTATSNTGGDLVPNGAGCRVDHNVP